MNKEVEDMIKKAMDEHMKEYHADESVDKKIEKAESISELDKAVKDE